MRKRQKPYVLIMFVLVAAGGVVFMSLAQSNSGQTAAAADPPQTGNKDIQVPDKKTMKDIVQGMAKQAKKGVEADRAKNHNPLKAEEPGPPQNTDRPVVAMDKPAPYTPQPNPSSTANQWWTAESTKSYEPKATPDATKNSPPPPPTRSNSLMRAKATP